MAGDAWWKRKSGDGLAIADAPAPSPRSFWQRLVQAPLWLKIVLGAALFLAFWYGVVGTLQASIRPDLTLRPTIQQLPAGGSVTVAMAARLVQHEVDERSFTPNDPFFFPTGFTRRTPAYQAEVIETGRDVISALAEQAPTPGLVAAAEALATPPEQWWLQLGWPLVQPSAERQYRRSMVALVEHNRAMAAGQGRATAPVAAKRLDPASAAALATLVAAVDAQAEAGDRLIRGAGAGNPSVQLAAARGTAFAAAMLMRGLRDDNAASIRLSGRAARWGEALDALDAAAAVNPIVTRQTDLVTVGYSLLIAGNAMRDILQGAN